MNLNYMIICDIGLYLCYELRYDIWCSRNTEQNDHADPDDSDIKFQSGYEYEYEYEYEYAYTHRHISKY